MENGYGELIEALSKAQKKFKPITKTKTARVFSQRTGKEFSYKYADLAEIIDNVKDALSDEGLAISHVMEPTQTGEMTLKTMLMHKNGKIMQSIYPLPKVATPQEMGSILTYARRYTLCGILGISADEDDDAQVAQDNQKQVQQKMNQQVEKQSAKKPVGSFEDSIPLTLPLENGSNTVQKGSDNGVAVDENDLKEINQLKKECKISSESFNELIKKNFNVSRFGELKKSDMAFLRGLLNSRKELIK